MNRRTIAVVVFLALIVGCAAGLVMNDVIEPPARAYAGPTWEHRCTRVLWEDIDKPTITNDLGPEGWELVAMSTAVKKHFGGESVEVITCFKRPVSAGP